jgi:hypothetical protein
LLLFVDIWRDHDRAAIVFFCTVIRLDVVVRPAAAKASNVPPSARRIMASIVVNVPGFSEDSVVMLQSVANDRTLFEVEAVEDRKVRRGAVRWIDIQPANSDASGE